MAHLKTFRARWLAEFQQQQQVQDATPATLSGLAPSQPAQLNGRVRKAERERGDRPSAAAAAEGPQQQGTQQPVHTQQPVNGVLPPRKRLLQSTGQEAPSGGGPVKKRREDEGRGPHAVRQAQEQQPPSPRSRPAAGQPKQARPGAAAAGGPGAGSKALAAKKEQQGRKEERGPGAKPSLARAEQDAGDKAAKPRPRPKPEGNGVAGRGGAAVKVEPAASRPPGIKQESGGSAGSHPSARHGEQPDLAALRPRVKAQGPTSRVRVDLLQGSARPQRLGMLDTTGSASPEELWAAVQSSFLAQLPPAATSEVPKPGSSSGPQLVYLDSDGDWMLLPPPHAWQLFRSGVKKLAVVCT